MKSDASNIAATIIKQNGELFKKFVNVYIFGSIMSSDRIPRDIDILLIYEKYSSEITADLIAIRMLLDKEMEIFVDFTVLSIEEEKSVSFLDRLNGKYLKLK